MNRWAVRIIGILIVLVFVLMMMNLQRQLILLQRSRQAAPTTTR
jgi:hypothetical protein